jgi:DNA-binding response OmpR family regulator
MKEDSMSHQRVLLIFVVDDERVIAATLAIILRTSGYAVSFFTDPLEALKCAEQDVPDLLISDVMMPQLSGVDLAILLRRLYPRCGILLFSGQTCTDDLLAEARTQGHSFELLCKPVHPAEIIRRVREHDRSYRSLRSKDLGLPGSTPKLDSFAHTFAHSSQRELPAPLSM